MRLLLSLLVCVSALAGEWRATGPYGGSATAITIDPQNPRRLLAGTHSSLLFLSEDAGEHWKALPFPRYFIGDLKVVQFDPTNSQRLLAGVQLSNSSEAGLYESRDAGQNWRAVPALRGLSVEALSFWTADPRRLIAGTHEGAYLSADSGATWARITPAGNDELRTITAIAIDPSDARTIYAGTPHLPWKTTDGGATWRPMHTGMIDDSDVMSISFDSRSSDRLYASACSGIYHSDMRGDRWVKYPGTAEHQRRTHVIRQDPANPLVLYAGTTAGLLKSVNGGLAWKQVNRYEVNGLALDPRQPGVLYLATERSGIVKSIDHGETFRESNIGFTNRQLRGLTATPRGLYVLAVPDGLAHGLYHSIDGRTWAPTGTMPSGHAVSTRAVTRMGGSLLFAHEGGVSRSNDSGGTWQPVPPPTRGTVPFDVHAIADVKGGVLLSTSSGILRSVDGAAWTVVQSLRPGYWPRDFSVSPNGMFVAAATAAGAALVSVDAGLHWRSIMLPLEAGKANEIAWSGDGSALLLAAATGLFRSSDGGAHWVQSSNGIPGGTVSHVLFLPDSSNVLAVAFGAVYRSRDAGVHWNLEAHAPTPAPRVQTLMLVQMPSVMVLCETVDMGLLFLEPEP